MSTRTIFEREVLEAIGAIESEQWPEVLRLLKSLPARKLSTNNHGAIFTGEDLLKSGLVGMWSGRTDIENSQQYARRLREEAQTRKRVE